MLNVLLPIHAMYCEPVYITYRIEVLKALHNSKNWNDIKLIKLFSNLSNGWIILRKHKINISKLVRKLVLVT